MDNKLCHLFCIMDKANEMVLSAIKMLLTGYASLDYLWVSGDIAAEPRGGFFASQPTDTYNSIFPYTDFKSI